MSAVFYPVPTPGLPNKSCHEIGDPCGLLPMALGLCPQL